ncbi:MAG: hypothetical protein II827_05340 [Paludibacteraceae bacterium]|nr:hypothetical protein [Paludibacteraceae bacterium]MBQ4391419.1 hypothetical protein [Paludibacteraceae bacterium]
MLHVLSSSLHHEDLQLPFEIDEQWAKENQVVAVLTGGSEEKFLQLVKDGKISIDKTIYLIATQQSNSLAASMEILSWINNNGGHGEIVSAPQGQPQRGTRLGVIGKPSDWLIASAVDYETAKKVFGVELIDIPIERVKDLGEVDGGKEGALKIYKRVKEIVDEYKLDGVTLRCFDLLTTVKNTGCLALSMLNDEGIPAACESDIPTLLTLMVIKRVTGLPGFQVNPARIDDKKGEMLFAHCTLPLKMCESHSYTTHFESGIGVAIHGELPLGDYTLVKICGDGKRVFAEDVQLLRNQYEPNLCRTQVWISISEEGRKYFLSNPIANHHVLVRGHHAKAIIDEVRGKR